jgi:hypothetical protein
MLRSSLITATALLLCGTAAAQKNPQTLKPLKIPAGTQIKNAGTYHMSTGTWTRGTAGTAAIGNDTVYTNDANTGYFTGLSTGDSVIDEGEIPALAFAPGADRDRYVINGFTTAYCTLDVRTDITFRYGWYDAYSPCGDPATLGLGGKEIEISLPGVFPGSNATGAFSCWLVTLDLMNTTAEFKMRASQTGTHDSSTATDSFGWSMEVDYPGGGAQPTGPFLNGDPNYYAFGDGTYYQNPGGAIPTSNTGTGFGTQDFFFGTGPGFNTSFTCYFFGGYKNTIGPNAASIPYGSFWMSMYSDENDVHDFLRYCGSETVASANTGLKSKMILETQDSTGALIGFDRSLAGNAAPNRMMAIVKDAPGLGNGGVTNIGYFIMGTGQNTFVPPGSAGPICVAPGLKRFLMPASMTSETIVYHNPFNGTPTTDVAQGFSRAVLGAGATEFIGVITPGSRWNFQAWFRDTPGLSNLSDAVSVDFIP